MLANKRGVSSPSNPFNYLQISVALPFTNNTQKFTLWSPFLQDITT